MKYLNLLPFSPPNAVVKKGERITGFSSGEKTTSDFVAVRTERTLCLMCHLLKFFSVGYSKQLCEAAGLQEGLLTCYYTQRNYGLWKDEQCNYASWSVTLLIFRVRFVLALIIALKIRANVWISKALQGLKLVHGFNFVKMGPSA